MLSSLVSSFSSLLSSPPPPFEKVVAPVDEEGFVKSFSLAEGEEARKFFEEYGFVVIRGILSEDETARMVDELWEEQESGGKVKRDAPSTWKHFSGSSSVGIMGRGITDSRAAWEIRQHPHLHRAFASVLGEEDLLVSLDRAGLMRPTRGVRMENGQVEDQPGWKTTSQWFHWDLNPWGYLEEKRRPPAEQEREACTIDGVPVWDHTARSVGEFVCENNARSQAYFEGTDKVQGVVSLLDSREDTGGFICVPGFHRYLPHWVRKNPRRSRAPFVSVDVRDGDVAPNAQKITMRRGSLCIWSSRLPHCNYPNEGSEFRACLYVKMFPRSSLPQSVEGYLEARARALQAFLPDGFEPSPLGRKVFGMEPFGERKEE